MRNKIVPPIDPALKSTNNLHVVKLLWRINFFGRLAMLVGVPREIKDNEFRVGMTPAVVTELVHHGHSVLVETSAGTGSGLTADEDRAAGATTAGNARRSF